MNKSKSHDILAKLLATENIIVSRENVQTASFDIKNRVLRLPRWKDLTQEIEEMLLLHEVGHALYTTVDGYGVVYDTKKHLKGYANIIEDVRIEKKMKDRYPGSRKCFNMGYTQLNERDFFKVRGKDLSKLLLIDRINIFYKVGYASGVQFTPEEYVYVQRADQCKTEEDVIKLAEDIFNFSKAEKEEEQEEQKTYKISGGGEDSDVDPDEIADDAEDLTPETIDAFDESLSNIQDHDSRTVYYEPDFESHGEKVLIGYKHILEELSTYYDDQSRAALRINATEFKTSSTSIVNYLVKEFEMRKSADAYKRIKISRLGQIDMRKLYAYQLKDDIFRQMATVQEGKKHGMIFLLDWSGSMNSYMHETVEQVINLAMFCRKINIPFQVLGFSDGYVYDDDYYRQPPVTPGNENGLGSSGGLSLLEFFSDKMNTRDFNAMIEYLLNRPWRHKKYTLNGTPLNTALIYCAKYIGEFIQKNNVEKMTLITLSDGESNELYPTRSIRKGYAYIYEDNQSRRFNVTSILRDPKTKKEYELSDNAAEQTATLMNLIRDRYGIHSVGFYVTNANQKSIERFVKNNMKFEATASKRYNVSYKIFSDLRKNKCAITKEIPGRDEMYVIATSSKIQDEELEDVTQDMSASQIARQLGKVFNSRKTSRVVLNSFVGMVA